ncbi:Outer membrane lipoprotein-sorting protein [Alteromonas sp. 38]|uniref:outer membrane lipoprotein-sorting protein n=1 Tax=unclassified Alteromonas TaxID=2614992 RepID=UPI0012EFD4A6|nr:MULTISPECIES: outer membrane lipoprotein-sorting protein [unclassified Alteromonas]CAD5248770.1 Outer membrane lipoprotein-sorting protein [Alteromonas sp. 154]VXC49588.1 Outer membrane lipoprotein-sorting protein [Alteromonas sp. 38]
MRNSMLHITNVNRDFLVMARANTHINTKTSNSSVRVWLTSMLLLCFSFAAVTPVTANAQEDVASIIAKSEKAAYYAGNDGKSMARMIIVDSQGRKQMRQFTILRKDVLNNEGTESGDQKMLVFFSRPTEVKGTVFRVEKHTNIDTDDDRWLYLPALDLVKRIAAGDKRTSFVGSHFFYEDVSGRAVSEDNFTMQNTTDTHYVLRATPKSAGSVEFSHYVVEIDKQTYLPTLINFFKEDDNYRRVEAVSVDTVQGYPTVVRSKVSDLASGGYTLMEFRGIQYDIALPDSIFSERSLRVPPREFVE